MRRLKLIPLFAVLFAVAMSVDKNNFKTCEQSSFCRRLRSHTATESPFEVLLESVFYSGDSVVAEVLNNNSKAKFVLKITAVQDGTFRVLVDEKESLYPRYKVQYALNGEPKTESLKLHEKSAGSVTVINGQGHKVIIHAKPLKIEFLDLNGKVAAIINDRGLMAIEHLRKKPSDAPVQEGEESAIEQPAANGDLGEWEENYKSHHDTKPRGPEALALDISFPDAAQVYGIPEHADLFALRTTKSGEPYRLYNLDVFEYELDSPMATYGSIPVMYAHGSERSVGVFWHNAAETWVDIDNWGDSNVVSSIVSLVTGSGSAKHRVDARFISESGVFDAFVMLGPKPEDTFRQYTALTGVSNLPPLFSLAYHQSRWNYNDEEDVRGVDENFDAHDIPADVIWLDIEYTDRKKYFTWDPDKFAHPSAMVSNLTAKGRKLVVIIDPHIKREAGYFLHEDATEKGYYVKNKDGSDYEGWCWPGSSSYLDFFNPVVADYYSSRYSFENFPGTSKDVHIWNDMNEPSVFNGPEVTMPKDCQHYKAPETGLEGISSFWEHRHVHNEYGLAHVRATYRGVYDRSGGKYRPFILSRANFAGTQRYAAVWTGDNFAEWSHLAVTVPMCLSLGVAGISFCGADVGGFFKNPDAQLMTRWYQAGAFQPFFRAHSHIETKRREPWLFDAATTKLIRDAVRKRYTHLPLWYTLFHEHTQNGSPVMRPLFMQYPKEKETYTIGNQYMLGDVLLIRPVVEEGVTSVSVYLPGLDAGDVWYDADSYQPHEAKGSMNQEVSIAKIPVYQRGGTILPKKERVRRSSALMADDPYTFIIALDKNNTAHGSLYIDDGETFDYQTRKFIYAKLAYVNNVISYTFVDKAAKYPTKSWVERIVIAGLTSPPKSAKLQISSEKPTSLQMTYHKGNNVLVIRKPAASMAQEWKITVNFA